MKTWLVTGATRGIGRAVVDQLLERGDRVIAAVRNPADLAGSKAIVVKLDSTSDADAAEAIKVLREQHDVDSIDVGLWQRWLAG